MSSTTEGPVRNSRGQALVVFAIILTGLLLVAALAIDVGFIMLERRAEQNAADAAALAGARFLPDASAARTAAASIATANGYTQGVDGASVTIGATTTRIQVTIRRDMASFFGGLAGHPDWPVSAFAVAVSLQDQPPFASLTALNLHDCQAVQITGTGSVNSNGDVQVNSDCPTDALLISGQGNLVLAHNGLACYVVGGSQISGKANGTYCDPPQPGVPISFPSSGMPSNTATPTPPLQVGGTAKAIPDGCPGTAGYSDTTPKTCQFNSSYAGTSWRLYPGYYPGGIKIQSGGTFYLEPGIYELAGGGFTVTGTGASATSVEPGTTTFGGGVLFFVTTHPNASCGNGPCIQMGGNDAIFHFWPLGGIDESCSGPSNGWNRYLIFQDPAVTNPVIINGGGNNTDARGLIFAPSADVTVNGGTGTLTMDAIVADTFKINGHGGTINVLYDNCALPTYTGYGLVI